MVRCPCNYLLKRTIAEVKLDVQCIVLLTLINVSALVNAK